METVKKHSSEMLNKFSKHGSLEIHEIVIATAKVQHTPCIHI